MRDLVNVEGIPFDVLNKGITWDWETFPEFIDAAAARKPSLNLAFIAPLTPFRHYVMGEASMERAADAGGDGEDQGAARRGDRCRRVRLLLDHAQPAPGLRGQAARLPQRQPRGAEGLRQRAQEARQGRDRDRAHPPDRRAGGRPVRAAAISCSTESGRPVTFLALFDRDDIPEAVRDTLRRAAPHDRQGRAAADLAAAADPRNQHAQPVLLRRLPVMEAGVRRQSKEAQTAVYADPAFRNQFREDLKNPTGFGNWARITVYEVKNPGAEGARGQHDRRHRPGAGQGRRRRLPRPDAGRRSRLRAHHGLVQHARGPHARAPEQQVDPDGAGRRRRACRHAVRRRLPDLSARHLGAREARR